MSENVSLDRMMSARTSYNARQDSELEALLNEKLINLFRKFCQSHSSKCANLLQYINNDVPVA